MSIKVKEKKGKIVKLKHLDMNDEEYRREELIREIERRVERMTLRQLEALQYELETKDYSADDA